MLEKLAEIVREQASDWDDYNDLTLRCMECDFKPILGEGCRNMSGKDCPLLFNREEKADFVDGSLMLARWAVLLVAKGLEERLAAYKKAKDEYRKIHTDDDSDEEWCAEQWFHRRAFQVSEAIRDLIAEAKEEKGMNIAVDSKVKGRMPECVDMGIVVVDAPNLTSEQISELAQPISPDTATQPSILKTILQQLILINERLEKWEQTYIAYQEMRRVGSRPVYKKKEEK